MDEVWSDLSIERLLLSDVISLWNDLDLGGGDQSFNLTAETQFKKLHFLANLRTW